MGFQSGAMNLNRVLGAAAMGLIIAWFSFQTAYALSICLYLAAIGCMFGIERSRSDESGAEKKPLLADILLGVSYIRANRPVLVCLLFGLLPMFLAMPFQNILVVLAEQAWDAGESGVGILMATGGVLGASLLLILLVTIFYLGSRTLRDMDTMVEAAITDRQYDEMKTP